MARQEDIIEVYKTAISLVQYEGSLVWSRFGVLLVINTFVLSAIGFLFNESKLPDNIFYLFLLVISLIGIIFGWLWYHVTARGFSVIQLWMQSARELEEKIPSANLYKRGEKFKNNEIVRFRYPGAKPLRRSWFVRNRLRTEYAGLIIIWIFIIIYGVLFWISLTNSLKGSTIKKPTQVNLRIIPTNTPSPTLIPTSTSIPKFPTTRSSQALERCSEYNSFELGKKLREAYPESYPGISDELLGDIFLKKFLGC